MRHLLRSLLSSHHDYSFLPPLPRGEQSLSPLTLLLNCLESPPLSCTTSTWSPSIFDKSGLQHSSIEIKIPILDGFYVSQMNLIISYDLPSNVLLSSNWILLCKPVFIDSHPFISNPVPETAQELPHPHSWQPINGLSLHFHVAPLP